MNIKNRFKKEKASHKRTFFLSLIIMGLMPYMVVILNEEDIFKGWEFDFALAYALLIDLLLILHLIKNINDYRIRYQIIGRKIKINDSLFKFSYSIPFEKIIYVDVIDKKNMDFQIVLIMKKGKKNKNFIPFNISYVKTHIQYKNIYEHLNSKETVDYNSIMINKGGAKKFYLLYIIFKNAYSTEFSAKALDYVKKFMEEYNMA